jgi:large subunit ribosomal protein L4
MVKELTKINIYNLEGKEVDKMDVPVFKIDEEKARGFISDVAVMYQANRKKHMGNTKTRAEVNHSTKKPWKQKGTGRARAGMTSSPLWVGGGIVFAPKYRAVKKKISQKARQKALLLTVILKLNSSKFKVIDSDQVEKARTKVVGNFLKGMKLKSSLFVIEKDNKNLYLSARNIQKTEVMKIKDLNTYDLLKYDNVIFTKSVFSETIKKCEQMLKEQRG